MNAPPPLAPPVSSHRARRRDYRRRVVVTGMAIALLATPAAGQRIPRQVMGIAIGAATGAALTGIYAAFRPAEDQGGCSQTACVGLVTIGGGGFLGFLIGNEFEKSYRARYRHAPPLNLAGESHPLPLTPTDLRLAAERLLVSGDGGVELLATGAPPSSLGTRARGLRGISTADIHVPTEGLTVATGFGLYRFPLGGDEPGQLVVPGETSALAIAGPGVAYATVFEIVLARYVGDSLTALGAPLEEESRVTHLRWSDDGLLWVVTEERLAVYRLRNGGTELELVGALALRTPGRSVALAGGMAMVAAGSGGVIAVDARDPSALRETTNWSGARFAYDVAALGPRLYVAAGPEGLYVLDIKESALEARGLVRNLGFVSGVETGPDAIYVLDRTGVLLRRLEPEAR